MDPDVSGPYIVWQDYGYDGWKPTSFKTLKEALYAQKWVSTWVITKTVDSEVTEIDQRV